MIYTGQKPGGCVKKLGALLLFLAPAFAQTGIPVFVGPTISFLPPALDAGGNQIAFGSSVTPQGSVRNTIDLYAGTAKLGSNVSAVGMTRDGSRAVFTEILDGGESVSIADISSGAVQRLKVDTQGCIRPLALCISCFFACVITPHSTADAGKILYAVRRNQPFFVVNSDGTGLTQLPVYSGALAPAQQRAISRDGRVVFASSAPFGPTFAAQATDVYIMNLDGTGIKNLTNFGSNSNIFSSNATISQDGATIVFETNYTGAGSPPADETQIWAVQSDGSGLRQLTFPPGAATSPSISGDGKTGVFLQAGLINLLQPFVNVQPQGLRFSIAVFRYSVPQSPVISEDGSRVAFLIGPTDSSAGAAWEVNTNGSGLHAVYAPRAISPRGVVSAAGFSVPPSLGGLVSVYGINFSSDSVTSADGFPLPDVLGGASLLLNGRRLPMLAVAPWQITSQVPQETPAATSNFQLSFADAAVTPPEVANVAPAAPALFARLAERGGASIYQAAAFHAGTTIPVDDDHPARAGEVLEMYGTGIGVTDPVVAAGEPSPANPVARARLQPVVRIGSVDASVLFAGLTPALAGVAQVNIVVPSGMKPGRYLVSLTSSNAGALGTIAIQ